MVCLSSWMKALVVGGVTTLVVACVADGDRLITGDVADAPPDEPWAVSFVPQPGLSGILPQLATHRVVFVGETHDRYEHHLAQLRIIEALHREHPGLAIGMEFFQQPFQPVLDDFVAGRIDEQEMLRRSDYYRRWGYDYRLYRPILRYAQANGIPLVALNVPRELTRRVSEVGIDGLAAEERARLPQTIAPADADYRARLQRVFEQHAGRSGRDFDSMLQVQLVWDEGMAEAAADYLRAHPGAHMVVLAGSGHIDAQGSIPARLERRLPLDWARVVLRAPGPHAPPRSGDYYLLAAGQELPKAGLLGVMLDGGQSPVRVAGFAPHSDARKQGMAAGDRIVGIGGRPVRDLTDLKLLLQERRPGQRVEVAVARGGEGAGEGEGAEGGAEGGAGAGEDAARQEQRLELRIQLR